jgi:GDP-4-dehydro-6-deoxy-D-mannose reductase
LTHRILVTGARGFIARPLAAELASLGHEVVGLQHDQPAVAQSPEGVVRLISCDLVNAAQTADVIADVEPSVVVHLAAGRVGIEIESVQSVASDDLAMTRNLLGALGRSHSVRHVLFASSAAVYDPSAPMPVAETAAIQPRSPYGASKAAAETLIREFARRPCAVTVLRFANVVGPGERRPSVVSSVSRQIAEIESGKRAASIKHGRLDEARDLVDVRDVARAIASCCQLDPLGSRTYNVGTGNAVAISDVVNSLAGMARIPVRLALDPALVRPGPALRIALDPSALRAAVGWRAEVPLERSLADVLNSWRDQVHG